MIVKLDDFLKFRGENTKKMKPPSSIISKYTNNSWYLGSHEEIRSDVEYRQHGNPAHITV